VDKKVGKRGKAKEKMGKENKSKIGNNVFLYHFYTCTVHKYVLICHGADEKYARLSSVLHLEPQE